MSTLTEPQTFRFPTDIVDRMRAASASSQIPQVRLATRAMREFLDREFPVNPTDAAENAPS